MPTSDNSRLAPRNAPARWRPAAVGILLLLARVASANAAGDTASMFSFQGFGTLGAAHSDTTQADYIGNFFQPDGAGHGRSWAIGVDSKLGAQVDATFDDKLSAVAQVVSQHRYDSSYGPQIEWANLKYRFTPEFDILAGRVVAASFMLSDARLVGYAYPWVRPPQEVYGVLPVTNLDGIGANYRLPLGDGTNSISVSYGWTSPKLAGGGKIEARRFLVANNTFELGPNTFRVGYTSFRADLRNPATDALFGGFTQFGGARSIALRDQYQLVDVPYSVINLGMSLDPGDWLLLAEWTTTRSSAVVSNNTAWYVTGGYRIGKFTPYLTLAQLKPDRIIEPGMSLAGLPAPQAATAASLNAGLSAMIDSFAFAQKSLSIGTRWDFARNTALKLQYDREILGSYSSGRLGNVQPGFQPGSAVNIFSFALDFVF